MWSQKNFGQNTKYRAFGAVMLQHVGFFLNSAHLLEGVLLVEAALLV